MIRAFFAKVHKISSWTLDSSQRKFLYIFSNHYTTQDIFQNFHDFELMGQPNTSSSRARQASSNRTEVIT